MLMETETWVAIGFVLFIALLAYLGVHKSITRALDHRADKIKAELDDAKRLKDEAMALLAEYQKKRQEAETEAQAIVAEAKVEAERMAADAKVKAEEFVARRTKMAEQKIAQAEAQAIADVRGAATEAAVAAAERILAVEAKGEVAANLIAKGIEDVRKKLN
ncbi:MAG: ATP synthase F0 sector subunit b [Pseudolabrys sp.]|jgi:F-type H+-transporting ATPase subunit b|nr:ATP synthase F0 sector subunit b [Pseudolabrys sp.]